MLQGGFIHTLTHSELGLKSEQKQNREGMSDKDRIKEGKPQLAGAGRDREEMVEGWTGPAEDSGVSEGSTQSTFFQGPAHRTNMAAMIRVGGLSDVTTTRNHQPQMAMCLPPRTALLEVQTVQLHLLEPEAPSALVCPTVSEY